MPMRPTCRVCGAPVTLEPDGDPHYDTQYHYPTSEAYEKVCIARTKWQKRAEVAEKALQRIVSLGAVFDAKGTHSRRVVEIAATALNEREARHGDS